MYSCYFRSVRFKLTNSPVIPSPDTFWHRRILKHVSDVYLYVMMLRSQIPSNELRLLKTLLNRALIDMKGFCNTYTQTYYVCQLQFTRWCKSLLQGWTGRRLWTHSLLWPGHCSQGRGTEKDEGWIQTLETSASPESLNKKLADP